MNDALKLCDSDFVAIVDAVVELWNHIQARVFERVDFVVEGRLPGPARIERVRVVSQADVRFIMELEHISEYVSTGGVQTGFSAPPKGLKIVLHRLFRIGPDQ
ncbi:hypothetical protein ACFX2I_006227 [Malus domestica]